MPRRRDRGSGTVLALALGLVVISMAVLVAMLGQAATMASRAAAAADLAALAAADAARGITAGEPCAVAAEVARRHEARILSCVEGPGSTVQVRARLNAGMPFGAATGLARAGPPPPVPATSLPPPVPATALPPPVPATALPPPVPAMAPR